MPTDSRFKAILIICQTRVFYIPQSRCSRKETFDIDLVITYRTGDRKIIQPTTTQISYKNLEKKLVHPVQVNIYQRNTYSKNLNWLYFNDESMVRDRHQVKDQQSDAILQYNSILYKVYGRFTEIKSKFRSKKIYKTN